MNYIGRSACGVWIIRSNNSNPIRVFSKPCCTILSIYEGTGSLEGLPIYILRYWSISVRKLFIETERALKLDVSFNLTSSMKITCCSHNIRMPWSSKCRASKGMAVTVFNIMVSCSIQIAIHTAYSLKLHTLTCTCNLEIIILCCS